MTQRLSLLFALLLFPGVFFYSSAVAATLIPAILGGGFGVITITALAALLPTLFVSIVRLKGTSLLVTALFLALIIYTTVWLLVHHLLGSPTQGRLDIFMQWATLIATWLTLFSIGYFWPSTLSSKYIKFLLACMVGISLIVLTNVDFRRLIFLLGVSNIEGALSYQGLARSAAITGLILLSVLRNFCVSIIVAALLLIILFFIGARSELLGVVAVLPFIAYMHFRQRPLATATAVIVIGLIILCLAVYSYDLLSASRQFQILNISESTSGMARADLQNKAFEAIGHSPVLGDFAGHAGSYGEVGAYSHDVFSAWRQLGFVGFVLHLLLMLSSLVFSIRQLRKLQHRATDLPRIAGTLSLFCLILMLGAKPVFWALPALAWGLTVACYRHKPIITPSILPAERLRGGNPLGISSSGAPALK